MRMTAINFTGRVAVITGASSGIGAATAELFSKLKATVVLSGRNTTALQAVSDRCKTNGVETLCVTGDMNNEADVKNLVDQSVAKFGKINVLVNCAGVLELGSIENTSMEQYDRVMGINSRSVYHLTMLCVPHLVATKGSIVNVSSVNGIRSFANVLAYNVSKAAVDQLTRCVALELAPKGVRVNAVNPGVIMTELQRRGGLSDDAYAKFLDRCKETHALGRVGQPEEVAEAIAFLASDNAAFITGVTLPVDGGRHAMCPR